MSDSTAINANAATVDRFVSSVLSGDIDTVRALCHPDFELHEGSGLPFAGTYKGADGFLGFLQIFGEALEIEKLAPVRTYTSSDPDYVACEIELESVVKATGKRFDSTMVEVWTFRDGRVLSIKPHYFNAV